MSSRTLAVAAYLLSLPGALAVLAVRRQDAFAAFHARQSLVIAVWAAVAPVLWAVAAWALAWVPAVGALLGVLLFALLLAAYAALALAWVLGMVYAAQGRARCLPLPGAAAR